MKTRAEGEILEAEAAGGDETIEGCEECMVGAGQGPRRDGREVGRGDLVVRPEPSMDNWEEPGGGTDGNHADSGNENRTSAGLLDVLGDGGEEDEELAKGKEFSSKITCLDK